MSSSGGDGKPFQTGLVDMGDISFYNNPATAVAFSTLLNADLGSFPGLFGEIVTTWNGQDVEVMTRHSPFIEVYFAQPQG